MNFKKIADTSFNFEHAIAGWGKSQFDQLLDWFVAAFTIQNYHMAQFCNAMWFDKIKK